MLCRSSRPRNVRSWVHENLWGIAAAEVGQIGLRGPRNIRNGPGSGGIHLHKFVGKYSRWRPDHILHISRFSSSPGIILRASGVHMPLDATAAMGATLT